MISDRCLLPHLSNDDLLDAMRFWSYAVDVWAVSGKVITVSHATTCTVNKILLALIDRECPDGAWRQNHKLQKAEVARHSSRSKLVKHSPVESPSRNCQLAQIPPSSKWINNHFLATKGWRKRNLQPKIQRQPCTLQWSCYCRARPIHGAVHNFNWTNTRLVLESPQKM